MLEGAELDNNVDGKGVEITEVERDSAAEAVGLKAGDLITGVNRQDIGTIAELRNYLKDNTGVLALKVVRGNRAMYLMIR